MTAQLQFFQMMGKDSSSDDDRFVIIVAAYSAAKARDVARGLLKQKGRTGLHIDAMFKLDMPKNQSVVYHTVEERH